MSGVDFTQSESSHHSNFVFVPDTSYTGDDGIWTCSDRSYDFYSAVAQGGVLFAQSTQSTSDEEKFAAGAAIRLPPHTRIISDIHLLNATPASITGHATITIDEAKAADVTVKLKAFHMEYTQSPPGKFESARAIVL